MILNISKGVKDMDKEKKDEEKTDLEEKVVTASTGELVDHMKQTGRPITLIVTL
jgi:hypothetical protein